MSNNKQIMKLYTETEIVSFLKKEFADEINAETFMENLTPIELPSDEEILKRYIFYIDTEIQLGFLEESQGARLKWYYTKYFSKWYYTKYFSNKIQGGNNEQ